MIGRVRRALNPQQAQWMAPKQGRYMQMFSDDEVAQVQRAMINKGEVYDMDLFPDKELVARARNDFDGYRTGTPDMDVIGNDMRSFYGMQPSAPTVESALTAVMPTLSKADQAIAKEVLADPTPIKTAPKPKAKPQPTPQGKTQYSEPIGPQEFKDEKVAEVMQDLGITDRTTEQQVAISNQIDAALESLKPKGFILEDPLQDTALLASLALLAGGGVGRATAPSAEEELMALQEENPGLMIRYA